MSTAPSEATMTREEAKRIRLRVLAMLDELDDDDWHGYISEARSALLMVSRSPVPAPPVTRV